MQTAVEAHMAQKYRISDKNDKEVFDFLKQNFGCNRKVYNLCVDSLYAQLEKAGHFSRVVPSLYVRVYRIFRYKRNEK